MTLEIHSFFEASDFLEYEVLRPLSHIRGGWGLYVDHTTGRYEDEEDTFAWLLNHLIDELCSSAPAARYHDSEDRLAEHVQESLNWKIKKVGNQWLNEKSVRLAPSDYLAALEQGGFQINGEKNLLEAASGRVAAAIRHGHAHFDEMERGHQVILAGVLATILYHWEPYEEEMRASAAEQGVQRDGYAAR